MILRNYLPSAIVAICLLALPPIIIAQTNGVDGVDGDPGTAGTDGTTIGIIGSGLSLTGEEGGNGGRGGNGVDADGDGNAAGGNGGNGGDGLSIDLQPDFASLPLSGDRLILRATGGDGGNAGAGGSSLGVAPTSMDGNAGMGGSAAIGVEANFEGPTEIDLLTTATGGFGGVGRLGHGGSATSRGEASGFSLSSTSLAAGGDGNFNNSTGNAGIGGDASSIATLDVQGNFEPNDFASVRSSAVGGDGGDSRINGLGGDGGSAVASGNLLSEDTRGGIGVGAFGGDGGDGRTIAGNGGSVTLENAATGGTLGLINISQTARAGSGGRGGNAFFDDVGTAGRAGDAISRLNSTDVNQIGGDSRVVVSATGGGVVESDFSVLNSPSGGNATAAANIADTGDIELLIDANAGAGEAVIESGVASSTDGEVTVRTTAIGGQSTILDNVTDGNSPTSILLFQIAEGGSGRGINGADGDAFSRIQTQKSTSELTVFAVAEGNTATAVADLVNSGGSADGSARATADALATATSKSINNSNTVDSTATSTADGFNSVATSEARNLGAGSAFSVSRSTSDAGGIAESNSLAVATGGGDARATSNVTGTGTGTAHAESGAEATSTIFITGQNGGRTGDSGNDGDSLLNTAIATGSGGVKLITTTALAAGSGGAGARGGTAGNGGNASLVFSSGQVNSGIGSTDMFTQLFAGNGGTNSGIQTAGFGGDAILDLDLVAGTSPDFNLNTISNAGAGGNASNGGIGGSSGDASANVQLVSDSAGNISIIGSQLARTGGSATTDTNAAGHGGDASGVIFARSNGGVVSVSNVSTSGSGGRVFGDGQAGNAGIATSDVTAISIAGLTEANSRADSGEAGLVASGNGIVGSVFETTSRALADNSFSGNANGQFSEAGADATDGSTVDAVATARTGNDVFRGIQVVSTAIGSGRVSTESKARIGGTIPFNSSLAEAHGFLIVNPDRVVDPASCSCSGDGTDFLSSFNASSNDDTDSILAFGQMGAAHGNEEGALITERSVEATFEIAVEPTGDDLRLGFYNPETNGSAFFDTLSLDVEINGLFSETFEFDDRRSADDFFSFNVLSLGSLDGLDLITGTIRLDYTASDPGAAYEFNYLLGNAQADFDAVPSAVPEPSSTAVLMAGIMLYAYRRRRK